ncbi:ATP-dependent RNA helicase RhlB [Desulfocicer vacuolatum DSM 3385]|uniref:ATP-dependent RNA helicase RhlB n=2 Tax=Desulfocicer vacuolatum TaxID=2298 RepID=A0A1W2A6C7_9BACT|nr:ATP-dependent RNA helicase RhlB [Desulfocicer vacuolatum DSM 3385]
MEGKSRFHDFKLPLSIMHAIADLKFEYAMPVQAEVLPHALEGKDATAEAQTGTGKSAAFLVGIFTRLLRNPIRGKRERGTPRALILAPTRELVIQIEKDGRGLARYTPLRIVSVFGGMDYKKQQEALAHRHVDVIAATPGRLIDFMGQKIINLKKVEILVLDEADRMLDMGFLPDIRRIIYATPHKDRRQTMFFSATLSPEILRLASQWTKDPVKIEIDPGHTASESVNQKVFIVTEDEKFILLYNLIHGEKLDRVIVFVNRRDTTRRLAHKCKEYGLNADILSGEVSQARRVKTLENFKNGKIKILVATDVAARGLHIEGISHVINYDLPQEPEHYVHRIGRTGRAGAEGISVSFADENSSFYIPAIEEVLGDSLACEYPDEAMMATLPKPRKIRVEPSKSKRRNSGGSSRRPSRNRRPPRRRSAPSSKKKPPVS